MEIFIMLFGVVIWFFAVIGIISVVKTLRHRKENRRRPVPAFDRRGTYLRSDRSATDEFCD